jgi:hypothetical protein
MLTEKSRIKGFMLSNDKTQNSGSIMSSDGSRNKETNEFRGSLCQVMDPENR